MILFLDIPGPAEAAPLLAVAQVAYFSASLVRWLATAGVAVMGLCILLCLYRIIRGPTLADRATALDVVGVQLIGLVILLTMLSGSLLFVDGMLVLALLSFAGTIAMAQFIARPYVLRYKAQSAPDEPVKHEPEPTAAVKAAQAPAAEDDDKRLSPGEGI